MNDEQNTITRDAELARRGDRDAFSRIYEHYARPLYFYVVVRVGHRETAEDILSVVWTKAWRSVTRCPSEHLAAWLYTIARHVLIDHLRSRHLEISWDELPELQDRHDVRSEAETRVQLTQIKQSLDILTPEQREVIMMRVWDDLSYEEIARVIGKTPVSCRMLMARAVKQLRLSQQLATLIFLIYALKP